LRAAHDKSEAGEDHDCNDDLNGHDASIRQHDADAQKRDENGLDCSASPPEQSDDQRRQRRG
jgi:hypothetical protein